MGISDFFSSPVENEVNKNFLENQQFIHTRNYKTGLNGLKQLYKNNPELFKKIALKNSLSNTLFSGYHEILINTPFKENLIYSIVLMKFAEIINPNSICWGKIGINLLNYLLQERTLLKNHGNLIEKCFNIKMSQENFFSRIKYVHNEDYFSNIDKEIEEKKLIVFSSEEKKIKGKELICHSFRIPIDSNNSNDRKTIIYQNVILWQKWHQLFCYNNEWKKGIEFLEKIEQSIKSSFFEEIEDFLKEKDLISLVKGTCYNITEEYSKALTIFNYLTLKSPEDTLLLEERGDILFKLQRYDEAANSYKEALSIVPDLDVQTKFDDAVNRINLRDTNNNNENRNTQILQLKEKLAKGLVSEYEFFELTK